MGILDSIGALVRGAVPAAIATRTGYLQGQSQERDRLEALKLKLAQMKREQDLADSTIGANQARARNYDARTAAAEDGGEPVTWVIDGHGNRVPLPKKIHNTPSSSGVSGASSSPAPTFNARPSAKGFQRALQGGSIADDSETPEDDGLLSKLKGDVGSSTSDQGPTFKLGQPSGVGSPSKPTPAAKLKKENTVNLSTGNIEDVFTDGTRKVVRKATADEIAKAKRIPGNGGRSSANGADAQARLDALAALKTATAMTPRPSKVPEAQPMLVQPNGKGGVKVAPNPAYGHREQDPAYQAAVADSIAYDKNTLGPLRENVKNVTVHTRAKIGNFTPPGAAAPTPDSTTDNPDDLPPGVTRSGNEIDLGGGGAAPAAPKVDMKAMQKEFDDAGAQLNDVINSNLSPALKAQAKAAYQKHLASIAKKYKATTAR